MTVFSTVPIPMILNIPLLERIRAAAGDFVPLHELGADLERVRIDLDALIAFGFGVEEHPYRGAAYAGPAERLCPDQIEHELATRWIGRRIAVWNRVGSTNDVAARAGHSESNDGLVVMAEDQTAGRGRRGRSWIAPPRTSILMSVVLFPPRHLAPAAPESAFGGAWLTALAAVAIAEVVAAWTGRDATIKWPNDVRVGGRKIAGILVERALASSLPDSLCSPVQSVEPSGAVIGIGLNVNLDGDNFPPELRAMATSIQIECDGMLVDRSALARDLIRRLDYWYDTSRSQGSGALNDCWRARSEHIGTIVRVETPAGRLDGRLIDIDLDLGLTLDFVSLPDRELCVVSAPRMTRLPLADILALDAREK
jgi:BirA family transcriptional regulator, biotin operon repressor / biotin---[acetyl-CoA-carboxylase] ligase